MKQPRAQRIGDSPGVTFRWQGKARRNRQLPRCRVPPAAVPKPLDGIHSRRPGLIESREGARTEPMAFCFTECTEDVEPRKAMSDLRSLSIWRPSLGATSACVHSSRDNCRSQKPELGWLLPTKSLAATTLAWSSCSARRYRRLAGVVLKEMVETEENRGLYVKERT